MSTSHRSPHLLTIWRLRHAQKIIRDWLKSQLLMQVTKCRLLRAILRGSLVRLLGILEAPTKRCFKPTSGRHSNRSPLAILSLSFIKPCCPRSDIRASIHFAWQLKHLTPYFPRHSCVQGLACKGLGKIWLLEPLEAILPSTTSTMTTLILLVCLPQCINGALSAISKYLEFQIPTNEDV